MRRTGEGTPKLNRQRAPASSQEARENQLTSLAEALAEKQMMEGTASSQVITYYLKLGSQREKLEREKLRSEVEMLKAKKEALESAQRIEELYSEAMKAVKTYRGERDEVDD